jgi:hypothetical protein
MTTAGAGHLIRIRDFFFAPQATYTLDELAGLWQVSGDVVLDMYRDWLIRTGCADCNDRLRVPWLEVLETSVTFNLFRPYDVEIALGTEFARFRPVGWKTVPVLIRLPRLVIDGIIAGATLLPGLSLPAKVEQFVLDAFVEDGLLG